MKEAEGYFNRVLSVANVWTTAFSKQAFTMLGFQSDSEPLLTQLRDWKWNPAGMISNFKPIYDQLKGEPPYDKAKDEIEKMTKNIHNDLVGIYPQLPMIFANMIVEACQSKPHMTKQFQGDSFLLTGADAMHNAFGNSHPHMVYAQQRSRQIVLVCDLIETLTSLDTSNSVPSNFRIICFVRYPSPASLSGNFWFVQWEDSDRFVKEGAATLTKAMQFLEADDGDLPAVRT